MCMLLSGQLLGGAQKAPSICDMYAEIKKQELKFPMIVLAQSIMEAGWRYDSYNARARNNFFGLWDSKAHKYRTFDTWQESVKCYKEKFQYKYKGGDYFKFLEKAGYATAEKYCTSLRWIIKRLTKRYAECFIFY